MPPMPSATLSNATASPLTARAACRRTGSVTARGTAGRLGPILVALGVVALIAVAFGLRLAWLSLRPPHHDEGVNGWFVERLLRDGYYRYDPRNYHGPAYFYLLAASRAVLGFGITALRVPAAVIGACACFVPLLLSRQIGRRSAFAACALLVISPTLVYYARDAIHETLLAALGLLAACCTVRWAATRRAAWLFAAGAAFAAMIATKETTIVFAGVVGLWLGAEIAVGSARARRLQVFRRPLAWSWRAAAITAGVVAVAAAVHIALFTGLLRVPDGIAETLRRSIRAYAIWRATGEGHTGHDKPWTYYLALAGRYELVLYGLALAGAIAGWRDRVVRAFAAIGFGMLAAYSSIAYKMPWLPLSWLVLLSIPAGHGAVAIATWLGGRRAALGFAVALAAAAPLAITVRSSFVQPADPDEALAYVHTAPDYATWFGLIQEVAGVVGPARLRIAVEHEVQWPLAWALLPYRTTWDAKGDEDIIIAAPRRAASVEATLTRRYYRRQFLVRDNAEPAIVYVRAPWRASPPLRATFTLVGPDRTPSRS